jgi:hypothetical protein
MSEFSISEAAFSGLRLAARKPTTILVWSLAYLVVSVGLAALMVVMAGPALSEMQGLQAQARADPTSANPAATLALMGQIMPFYLLLIPISLLLSAVFVGAVTRSVLRPAEGGLGYLRLGGDEFRLVVVSLVIGVILFIVYIVGAIVIGIAAVATRAGGGNPGAAIPVVIGLACLFGLALFYLASRFSMAPSLTLDRRSINIFGSFGLTKGRSGRVFLACLLALLLNVLIVAVGIAIVAGAAVVLGGGPQAAMKVFQPDMRSLTGLFTPVMMVYYVVMSLVGGLGLATIISPPAVIYQALVKDGVDEVF